MLVDENEGADLLDSLPTCQLSQLLGVDYLSW
jgi:hypothetical protein